MDIEKGIRFECQGSGNCCVSRGTYGFVYLSKKDIKKLSDGFTGIREVISHAAEWLEENNYNPEYICCILATAPLIMINDIKVGLDILKGGKCDYVFTGTPYPYPIKRSIYIDSNDYAKMLYPENSEKRSQDLDDSFHDAGQFYF